MYRTARFNLPGYVVYEKFCVQGKPRMGIFTGDDFPFHNRIPEYRDTNYKNISDKPGEKFENRINFVISMPGLQEGLRNRYFSITL